MPAYHPVREQNVGHLLLLKNCFGKCIGGSHPNLQEGTSRLIQYATVNHARKMRIEEFYSIEAMSIECNPKCGGCKSGKCLLSGKDFTLNEEREFNLIEKGFEWKGDHWVTSYPWIKDPNCLPSNYNLAEKMLCSLERRIINNVEDAKTCNEQIQDMVDRNAAHKLSKEEIESYSTLHYLSHYEVLKPDFLSTPCCIVFNDSATF